MRNYQDILHWTKEEILDEVKDIQYLYGLSDVIRYGINRDETLKTQSVAEHSLLGIFLAKYFLKIEKSLLDVDPLRVYEMIMFHDAAEIETGDIVSYKKNKELMRDEVEMFGVVKDKSPENIGEDIREYLQEYEDQSTLESRFVKAIDKLEPSFYMFSEEGKTMLVQGMKFTREQFEYCRKREDDYIKQFPIMRKFHTCISEELEKGMYFVDYE